MSPLRSLIGNSGRPAQQGRKAEPAKLDSELQPLCFHSQAITTSILGWLLVHVCIPLLWHYPYAPSQRAQFVSSSYAPPFNSSATTPLMRLVGLDSTYLLLVWRWRSYRSITENNKTINSKLTGIRDAVRVKVVQINRFRLGFWLLVFSKRL